MATVVLLLLLYTTFCVNERDTQKKITTLILLPVQTNTHGSERWTWIRQYPNFPSTLTLQLLYLSQVPIIK